MKRSHVLTIWFAIAASVVFLLEISVSPDVVAPQATFNFKVQGSPIATVSADLVLLLAN